jgi:spore coat protein A
VKVRNRNELPVPVVTQLHGGRTPPDSDGYPTDFVMPKGVSTGHPMDGHGSMDVGGSGNFKYYAYPNEQRAMTLWYHDYRMDFTGPQNYRGLVGMYILRDEVEDELPLPQGEKEVPLIIADRTFNEDSSGTRRITQMGDVRNLFW